MTYRPSAAPRESGASEPGGASEIVRSGSVRSSTPLAMGGSLPVSPDASVPVMSTPGLASLVMLGSALPPAHLGRHASRGEAPRSGQITFPGARRQDAGRRL